MLNLDDIPRYPGRKGRYRKTVLTVMDDIGQQRFTAHQIISVVLRSNPNWPTPSVRSAVSYVISAGLRIGAIERIERSNGTVGGLYRCVDNTEEPLTVTLKGCSG